MNKFCPKCGTPIEKGIFCKACDPQTLEFKPIKIKLCPSKKYFLKGRWTKFDEIRDVTKVAIKKTIDKKIKLIQGLEAYPDILKKTGLKKNYDIIIEFEGEEYIIPISVEITTSPSFCKVGTTYFEGILQLRDANDEIKTFVKDELDANEIYVNKIDEKKDGADYYFIKKRFITRVADKLITKYGGFMDANAQLFTQDSQTSKELYRLNVVVYISPFKKGDAILKQDELMLITSVGKHNTCLDLIRGKNISFKYNPNEKHEYKQVEKQKAQAINTYPQITVLSNNTYEVIELKNPKKLDVEKNQTITFIEYEGTGYLIE